MFRKRTFVSARQLFLGAAWLCFLEHVRTRPLFALAESLRIARTAVTLQG